MNSMVTTISDFIPIKEDGIDPVEYIRPYLSNLDDPELRILIGSVLLLREVKFKLLKSLLAIDKLSVEENLGRILQTDLWEGTFSRSGFKITRLLKQIAQQKPNLTAEEKSILAFLKARFNTSFAELKLVFSMNYETVVYHLASFLARGLISIDIEDFETLNVIVYYKLDKKEADAITILEKQIVGFVKLSEGMPINSISEELQVPEHQVESALTELILSDSVLCSFNVSKSKFKGFDIIVSIKSFNVVFDKRQINMMSSNERIIIGIASMQKGVQINNLEKPLKLGRSQILKIISLLNGTGEFQFSLLKGEVITAISVPVFQANVAIDEIDRNSVINYRSLLGYLIAKSEVSISDIIKTMNISELNVIKGLVDLFLNGLIMGELTNLKQFKLQTVRSTKEEYVTLESWEKIIIGGLLAEEKLSMAKLGALLNLNRELTQERALSFISRNIGTTVITNAFLTLKGELKIPPLIQIQNLELVDQQLFSILITNRVITLKRLRVLFSLSNKELYRRVYYLIGSGLIILKTQRQTFTVQSFHSFNPVDTVDQLDTDLQQLIRQVDRMVSQKIRLNKLASILKWEVDDVNLDLSFLIGFGYFKGYIQGKTFIKKRGLFKFKDKPQCFECNNILDNFREPCPNCFARPPQCTVCRSKMNSSEDVVMCPHCKNPSHSRHIREWIRIKGFCPICRNAIKDNDLLPLSQ